MAGTYTMSELANETKRADAAAIDAELNRLHLALTESYGARWLRRGRQSLRPRMIQRKEIGARCRRAFPGDRSAATAAAMIVERRLLLELAERPTLHWLHALNQVDFARLW